MQRLFGLGLVVIGFVAGLAAVRSPSGADVEEGAAALEPLPPVALSVVEEELLLALRTPAPARAYRPSAAAASALARGRASLAALGADVENPCRDHAAFPCVERPLDGFFASLDALEDDSAARHAVVIAMGNSLIAADGIVDVVRARLQERFGDGGRGLLLAERISEHGVRRRTGSGDGFQPYYLSQGPRGDVPFGLSGVVHVGRAGARTAFSLAGERRLELMLHGEPAVEVRVDGDAVALSSPRAGGVVEAALPEGGKRLELRAKGAGVAVQGVVLERPTPGVVLDTVGLPAADSPRWMSADEGLVRAQLAARDPSLVMVMLGGVENRRIAWGAYSDDDIAKDLRALLARLRRGAPRASCLVVGPIDAVEGMLDERVLGRKVRPFTEREELTRVIALERRAALESGCAFFNLFEAMGGSGSLQRFARYGLLHEDHVHPRGFGLDILGELIADGLLREWRRTAPDVARRRVARALTPLADDGDAPLERTAALLARVMRGEQRHVRIGVVSDDDGFVAGIREALAAGLGPARLGLDDSGRIARVGVVVEPARANADYDVLVTREEPAARPTRDGPVVVRLGAADVGEAFVATVLKRL